MLLFVNNYCAPAYFLLEWKSVCLKFELKRSTYLDDNVTRVFCSMTQKNLIPVEQQSKIHFDSDHDSNINWLVIRWKLVCKYDDVEFFLNV